MHNYNKILNKSITIYFNEDIKKLGGSIRKTYFLLLQFRKFLWMKIMQLQEDYNVLSDKIY